MRRRFGVVTAASTPSRDGYRSQEATPAGLTVCGVAVKTLSDQRSSN